MKKSVGILGATGMIGQHYVSLLHNHPWFDLVSLASSTPSESYDKVVKNSWHPSSPIPTGYSLTSLDDFKPCEIIFSALPNNLAQRYEPFFAQMGCTVISSASCYRSCVPIIIPEVNAHQIFKSALLAKPNCVVPSFLIPLAPLHKRAKIKALSVTSLQAISGAGMNGLSASAIYDNVIPHISGEEEKLESEPLQILESDFPISAHCNRVFVLHGHLVCVSVSFEKKLEYEEILSIWEEPSSLSSPTAPKHPIMYHHSIERPQTRLDRDASSGMSVSVGRLRRCPILDWRFVALSNNLVRGGAGGGVLIAESLYGA